jgi:3-mercaptopyruvate sulfurtransferase SseA
MESLVSTDWLQAELGAADLRILDATWFLPSDGRDARAEYQAAHVPGAVFVDIDEVSDPASDLPHMLPPPHLMASRMQALGVRDGARIVVYDNSPLHSGARLWWMLRSFGARRVALLDGGLSKWTAERRPVESGARRPGTLHADAQGGRNRRQGGGAEPSRHRDRDRRRAQRRPVFRRGAGAAVGARLRAHARRQEPASGRTLQRR